jgi:cytoskeletal protein RodZ
MDDMITKPASPNPVSVEPVSFHDHLHHHRSTRILMIILGVVVVIAAVLVIWLQFFHKKTPVLSPAETLQQLQDSSQPVTSTPEQRAANLSTAQKNSIQYIVTPQQKLNILKALNK